MYKLLDFIIFFKANGPFLPLYGVALCVALFTVSYITKINKYYTLLSFYQSEDYIMYVYLVCIHFS